MLFARCSLLRASIPFSSQCAKTRVSQTMFGVSKFSQSCVNQASVHARRKFTSSVKQNVTKRGVVQKSSKSASESIDATASTGANLKGSSFSQRWMAPKEIPPKGTLNWYGEMTLICTVFAITGTSTMILVGTIEAIKWLSLVVNLPSLFLMFNFRYAQLFRMSLV